LGRVRLYFLSTFIVLPPSQFGLNLRNSNMMPFSIGF
jgi:hypothetical protein